MPVQQRILVIVGALLALWVVANKIRKNKILMGDAIFWMVLASVLVVLAAFPGITFFFAGVLGFVSPANLVFLVVVALLLFKVFSDSVQISMLKSKVEVLAQDRGLEKEAVRSTIYKQVNELRHANAKKDATLRDGAAKLPSTRAIPEFLRKD